MCGMAAAEEFQIPPVGEWSTRGGHYKIQDHQLSRKLEGTVMGIGVLPFTRTDQTPAHPMNFDPNRFVSSAS